MLYAYQGSGRVTENYQHYTDRDNGFPFPTLQHFSVFKNSIFIRFGIPEDLVPYVLFQHRCMCSF